VTSRIGGPTSTFNPGGGSMAGPRSGRARYLVSNNPSFALDSWEAQLFSRVAGPLCLSCDSRRRRGSVTRARRIVRVVASVLVLGGTAVMATSASASVASATKMCSLSELVASMKAGQGAAGTDYRPIVFTNKGSSPCLLKGTPGVQPVKGPKHAPVGPESRKDHVAGAGGTVRLAPRGGTANVIYGMGENLPTSCDSRSTDGVVVHLRGVGELFVALSSGSAQICTKGPNTTSVQGVRAGS
jgi:hypothetical protein